MAIEHNGKIIRSLPEQVGKNLTDIIKMMADITALTNLVNSKLTGAMHYKGSVATVADLPSTDNEIGDFYNVTSTGANYAWDGSQWDDIGSIVDLTPYARKDQNNTFSANNEFTGNVKVDTVLDVDDSVVFGITDIDDKIAQSSYTIIPTTIAEQNLGSSTYYYKTVYATEISNGVTTFTINDFQSMDQDISDIMQDYVTSQDLANYATKDKAFNVINASDIVNNTLTQEQFDLITNGKPTLISGTIAPYRNPILLPCVSDGQGYQRGFILGRATGLYSQKQGAFTIDESTKIITIGDALIEFSGNSNILIKGKQIPNNPSSTGTFVLKCVDGTLTWVAE